MNPEKGVPQVKRGNRQPRFLAQSVVLEEVGIPGIIRVAILTVCLSVAGFVFWAAITVVDEVAATTGEVVPSGQVQTIQHLEGGIISEILIREGDLVEAGEILLRLDPEAAHAELAQAKARRAGLMLKAERLRAFGEKRSPDFSFVGGEFASLVRDQQTIFEVQEDTRRNRRDVLLKQIDQRSSEVDLFEDQELTMEKNISLLEEELSMRQTLFEKGLSPKIVYLDIKRQVNQAQGDFAKLQGEWQRASEALDEARSRLAEEDAKIREKALSEMGSVTREVAQVRESINKLEDRVRRLDIKAPVRGIVKGLKANSVRGVLAPGAVIMEIVPMDEELVVEARITTNDVGHVRPGFPVKVKILTYDYARYGGITGVLKSVSATTFVDERNIPYYKGTIVLDRNYVGFDSEKNRVLPGMTVQADIKTGKKTLLQYLLKPVYSSVDRSFRER